MEVTSSWEGGYRCRLSVGEFSLVADEPEWAGGTNAGPAPTELMLASLASCFTMAMVFAAHRTDVTLPSDLAVSVRGHHEGPRFDRIEIDVQTAEPTSELEGLLDRAARYCYVSNTLRQSPEVSYRLRSTVEH
jgi:uncharacterized OsmC-like protein